MTENKRFKQSYVCGDFGLIDNAQAKGEQWIDLHSMGENGTKNVQICIDIMNDFADENEQLKADKQALIDFIIKVFPKSHKHILEGLV